MLFNAEAQKGNIHSSQTGNLLSGAPLASGGEIRSGTSIDQLLASLDRNGATGTFFVLGWVAEHHPEVVRAIAASGHEIASHGQTHSAVHSMTRQEFKDDLARSCEVLESITGKKV